MDTSCIHDIYCTCAGMPLNFWTDILFPLLLEIIGAFLGVFGAIWLSKKDARGKRKELVRSIKEELTIIKDELEERIKHSGESDYYRYPTQIWDINTRSGALNGLTLSDYKTYVEIYSLIEFAQETEREWFHSSLIVAKQADTNGYVSALNDKRWELALEIHKKITKLLGDL